MRMLRRDESHLPRFRLKATLSEDDRPAPAESQNQTPVVQPVAPPFAEAVLNNARPAGEEIRILARTECHLCHF